MKSILVLISLTIMEFGHAEQNNPLYEQIVFYFYSAEIIDSIP